jgi:hypothetical protein
MPDAPRFRHVRRCGYSLSGISAARETVAVPIFKNRTREPAVENVITAAVECLRHSGRLKVVPSRRRTRSWRRDHGTGSVHRVQPADNVTEYRLHVTVTIRFRDVRQEAMLWAQDGLQEWANFRVQGQVSDTIAREDVAARQAAVEIGRRIVSSAVDRF